MTEATVPGVLNGESAGPPVKSGRGWLRPNLRKILLISFLFWTLPVLYRFIQSYFAHIVLEIPPRPLFTSFFIFADWYYWVGITPLVFWLGSRFPLSAPGGIRNLLVHLPAAAAAAGLHVLLLAMILNRGAPESRFMEVLVRVASSFNDSFLLYSGILALCSSLDYSRRAREREVQAATLKHELSQAQLRALQMQLQPHFLFNTLNSISALTNKRPRDAIAMIAQLSELLRVVLATEPSHEITLENELNFLRTYLGIERVRFHDRLTLEFKIEPETLRAFVPTLILQPLVENAVRHGVSQRRGKSIIRIASRKMNDSLEVRIYDNGVGLRGLDPETALNEGIGLQNTRGRLAKLYGDEHVFDIVTGPKNEGVEVTIIVPFKTALI